MRIKINRSKLKSWLKTCRYWFFIVLMGILLAIVLRVFFFAIYSVPTPSMEPAIMPGDQVTVNKMIPGPRIIRNFFSLHKGEKPDIKRLRGTRAIRRNDILIFNYPYSNWNSLDLDMSLFYAKRCVAIPGDTFYIENGIYKVKNVSEYLGCYEKQERLSGMNPETFHPNIYHCFPSDERFGWNVKNFGPLYLPCKGDTLPLDTSNIVLYRNLVTYETGKTVTVAQGHVFINDSLITEYTFRGNYYFMAGDHVFDSKDSRYWGLLPEEHIAGKAVFVWQSKDKQTGKRRWERFLKRIR
ncbi:MAG: signal peptidase I [Tannerella sp.]|jgi:signal peptidase I|nr:signal peptidase I [Tannerella sp.]